MVFFQSDVFICMELMTTCLDKLMKRLQGPIPEEVLGKISVSVSLCIQYNVTIGQFKVDFT